MPHGSTVKNFLRVMILPLLLIGGAILSVSLVQITRNLESLGAQASDLAEARSVTDANSHRVGEAMERLGGGISVVRNESRLAFIVTLLTTTIAAILFLLLHPGERWFRIAVFILTIFLQAAPFVFGSIS